MENTWSQDTYFPLLTTSTCSSPSLLLCPRHKTRLPIHLLGTGTLHSPASGPAPVTPYPFEFFSMTLSSCLALWHWFALSWMFMVKLLKVSGVLPHLAVSFLIFCLANSSCFAFWTLRSISLGDPLYFIWIFPPCSPSWKFFQGSKLAQSQGSPQCMSLLRDQRPYCPMNCLQTTAS